MESAGTANDDIRPYADFNDVKDLVSQLYGFKVCMQCLYETNSYYQRSELHCEQIEL